MSSAGRCIGQEQQSLLPLRRINRYANPLWYPDDDAQNSRVRAKLEETKLLLWLSRNSQLHAKVLELRDEIEGWLTYIPQTFPHYTRHTVDHSIELVRQASRVLFGESDVPVVQLSSMEAYVICAAALLHDAGMVVSDKEKEALLQSPEWSRWLAAHPDLRSQFDAIESAGRQGETGVRWRANVELRRLLAAYFRAEHANRASLLIETEQSRLGRFAFDEPMLAKTIADVCVAHGLRHEALENRDKYPDRRDLLGDEVNVRFCAIILRLSDLLDLRVSRACPLLQTAGAPIPSDSEHHWSQYSRITHLSISPTDIEITAECMSPEEHRWLRDWCTWIVEECNAARRLLAGARRHASWRPPNASIGTGGATIKVRPSERASYYDLDWRFELSATEVLERLAVDVSVDDFGFIRELVQNAMDATRVAAADSVVDPSTLPIQIELETLPHNQEIVQAVTIVDRGVGMTEDRVRNFLLQVGKSWYKTAEFLENYSFVPIGRFGIGFLSVFGVSDHVVVDTKAREASPLRIVVTGPRSYIVAERSTRVENGTRVEVRLRMPVELAVLQERLGQLCSLSPIPVFLRVNGSSWDIAQQSPVSIVGPVQLRDGSELRLLTFESKKKGLDGSLFVLSRRKDGIDYWDVSDFDIMSFEANNPNVDIPRFPPAVVALFGVTLQFGRTNSNLDNVRINITDSFDLDAGRSIRVGRGRRSWRKVFDSEWARLLEEHLSVTCPLLDEPWKYVSRLEFRFGRMDYWASCRYGLPAWIDGVRKTVSLIELRSAESFVMISRLLTTRASELPELPRSSIVIFPAEVASSAHSLRSQLSSGRVIESIRSVGAGFFEVKWVNGDDRLDWNYESRVPFVDGVFASRMPDFCDMIVVKDRNASSWIALNSETEMGRWYIAFARRRDERARRLLLILEENREHPDRLRVLISEFAASLGEKSSGQFRMLVVH